MALLDPKPLCHYSLHELLRGGLAGDFSRNHLQPVGRVARAREGETGLAYDSAEPVNLKA
jgi:hypothetical protein